MPKLFIKCKYKNCNKFILCSKITKYKIYCIKHNHDKLNILIYILKKYQKKNIITNKRIII